MIKRLLLMVICFCLCLPAALAEEPVLVIDGHNADRVHLREAPTMTADSLGLYFTGTQVELRPLADPVEGWARVNIGMETGYVRWDYLGESGLVAPRQPQAAVSGIAADSWVNIRKWAALDADVVTQLHLGDAVIVLGETHDEWYYVRWGDLQGYIMSKYLTVTESVEPALPRQLDMLSAYRAVLDNAMPYIDVADGLEKYLGSQEAWFDPVRMQYDQFALVDVGGDEMPELLLQSTVESDHVGTKVLHWEQNAVYGEDFWYRAMLAIKADGTFSYSGGAADHGFGKLTFSTDLAQLAPIVYSESDSAGHVAYWHSGHRVTSAAFDEALRVQAAKPDLTWYPIEDEYVTVVLGQ